LKLLWTRFSWSWKQPKVQGKSFWKRGTKSSPEQKNCSEYIVTDGRVKARYTDYNISSLVSLSIGKVEAFLPKQFDACLIKLHLSKKFGVAKALCWLPNCLRPSTTIFKERVDPRPFKPELNEWNAKWGQSADVTESNTASSQRIKPTVDNLPDSIVKLSELDIAGLITKFGKREERLMKFGARTGYSEFWIGYGTVRLSFLCAGQEISTMTLSSRAVIAACMEWYLPSSSRLKLGTWC
jgi:hypothetical protein